MYCKQCGKEIDNDSKFCSYCGTKQSIILTDTKSQESNNNQISDTKNVKVSISFAKAREKKEVQEKVVIERYDNTYAGDVQASVFGIIFIILNLLLFFNIKVDNENDVATYKAIGAIVNLIFRIIATIWVVNIAKRQNRVTEGWGILAFITPAIALIIIGFLRKLNVLTITNNSNNEQELILEESSKEYDYSKITHKVKEVIKIKNFWTGDRNVYKIEFSDGKEGEIYSFGEDYFSILVDPGSVHIYYTTKESAIVALHYYLVTQKFLKKDRRD